MNENVWVVGFELKSNPLDDAGIECVCESEESARVQIIIQEVRHPKYHYYIMGDYPIMRLIPLGE